MAKLSSEQIEKARPIMDRMLRYAQMNGINAVIMSAYLEEAAPHLQYAQPAPDGDVLCPVTKEERSRLHNCDWFSPDEVDALLASRRAKPAEKALSLEERVVAQNRPAPDGLWTVLRDGIREPFAFTSQESADLYRICLIAEMRAGGGRPS